MIKKNKPKITNNSAKGVRWNLTDIYKNIRDPKINRDLSECLKRAKQFEKKYKGKINSNKLTISFLLGALKGYEKLIEDSYKPLFFANKIYAADNLDPAHGALKQKATEGYTQIQKHLIFFDLELTRLPENKIKFFLQDKKIGNYKHHIQKVRNFKKYQLSEAEEKILWEKNITSWQAWDKLFNEIDTDARFMLRGKKLSESEILTKLQEPDRRLRKEAAESLTGGLKQNAKTITHIFNNLLLDKKINDNLRKLPQPQSAMHLNNEVNDKTVDNLVRVCEENYNLVGEYYQLKGRLLDYEKLYDYDRYAPLEKNKKKVKFADAKKLVFDTLNKISPTFFDIAKKFFENKWLDAEIRTGKQGGGFCSAWSPKSHPVIFINYNEKLKDVMTLAHELGHGIHGYISKKQNLLNYDFVLVTAEIASIFSQTSVFESLKESCKNKKERLILVCEFLEDIFSYAFRQINMYKFELEIHKLRREKGELTTQEINKVWRDKNQEMFARSLIITEDYGYWWLYVNHVIIWPFYVYSYTFGELLALSIYSEYKKQGKEFVDKYIKLLSSGGREKPSELLKIVDQDITKADFWQKGMDLIRELLDEAKELAKEVSYKI